MDLSPKDQLTAIPELRTRLRQLRWYSRAFRGNADLVASHLGLRFATDEKLLNKTFFDWIAAARALTDGGPADRAERILVMGGLALRELIRTRPARLVEDLGSGAQADRNREIARLWPEGFLYTNFCVCGIAAVHEQEIGKPRRLDETASDLRTWWSFRENAAEDPEIAVAFLERFFGVEPNWLFPADRSAAEPALPGREERPALPG